MNKTTSADGTTIAYDRIGSGPAVILAGGALNDRRTPAPVAAGLADRFTVYSYDRRGRGDSGDTPPYAVEREIEDLAAIVAEAGGSAYVYGMSSGAVLAMRAAAAGLPITRLALYEPPLAAESPSAPPRPTDYLPRLTDALATGRRDEALRLFMVDLVGIPPHVAAHASQVPALQAIAHTLPYDAAVMGDETLPARVDVPTVAMAGGDSPQWMREAARAVGGEYRELAGQTHDADPAVLARALGEIFGSVAG